MEKMIHQGALPCTARGRGKKRVKMEQKKDFNQFTESNRTQRHLLRREREHNIDKIIPGNSLIQACPKKKKILRNSNNATGIPPKQT